MHDIKGEGMGRDARQQGGDRERDARELSSWEQEADMGLHGSTTFKPILRAMYDSLTGRMESISDGIHREESCLVLGLQRRPVPVAQDGVEAEARERFFRQVKTQFIQS